MSPAEGTSNAAVLIAAIESGTRVLRPPTIRDRFTKMLLMEQN